MKCKTCHKPLKENTEGNDRYCQGHDLIDIINKKNQDKIDRDFNTSGRAYTY